jgi:hypothetical protein
MQTTIKKTTLPKEFYFAIAIVLIFAGLLVIIDPSVNSWRGWIAYAVLLGLGAASIYGVRRMVEADRRTVTAALVSFGSRMVIGVTLALLLPVVGYQNSPEHQAGYIFTDAFFRDNQAWDLASSNKSITSAFSGGYSGDQYGGLLALSALVYRLLSPDAHRPFLILVINATVAALGVLFLWKATTRWFGEKTALLAAWIFALYPESVLLGSSQMREALLIPMIAMAFYGLTEVQSRKRSGWIWLLLSAVIMVPIQPLVSLISFAILLGIWFFDPLTLSGLKRRQTILVIVLMISALLIAMLLVSSVMANLPSLQASGPVNIYLTWFKNNFTFQSYMLERSSGIFQNLLQSIGEQWRWLVVLIYGIAQPVLPAIVGDPGAAWIMRIIGLLRAAGWYALALFLIYGTLGVLRSRDEARRYQLIWLSAVNWVWIALSALNAGGDQWDNPRYRAVLLVWQVVLAAWAWEWSRARRDAWLWRWLAVEAVFVGMFTEWYIGRYYPGIIHLDIKWMSLLTIVVCGMILLGGVVWDRLHKTPPISRDSSL